MSPYITLFLIDCSKKYVYIIGLSVIQSTPRLCNCVIYFSAGKKPVITVSYDSQYEEFTAVCEILLSGSVRADVSCNLYT